MDDYLNPRFPLPAERIKAIVDEVMATQRGAEDRAIAEKMSGARCLCCEQPIPGPAPGHTRECTDCAGYS